MAIMGESEKKAELVGASAKLEAAEKMKAAGRIATNKETAEGQSYSQNMPAAGIFFVSFLYVIILMELSGINISSWHITGDRSIDSFLTGSRGHRFIGDKDIDKIILAFLRALVFFLATGIIPLLGKIVHQFFPKNTINPFVSCWAAVAISPLLYMTFISFILPLLEDIIR